MTTLPASGRSAWRRAGARLAGLALALGLLAPALAAASQDGEGGQAEANYVKLHPDFVVNLRATGRPHFLLATVEVMSHDAEVTAAAKYHLPALRHELLLLLSDQRYDAMREMAERERLRQAALGAVNAVLERETGKAGVEGLYFTAFVVE